MDWWLAWISERIKPIENEGTFVGIRGDFTDEDILKRIEYVTGKKVDVILSDASPKLSGIKDIDQLRSLELTENALKISKSVLKNHGILVIKAFQGEEFDNILKKIKMEFKLVKTTKPPSSKKKSVEMYVLARDFIKN